MTADTLLTLALARSDQILWLWCFYAAAAGGLVLVAVTSDRLRANRRGLKAVVGTFAFFAYTHLECMRWVAKQWAGVHAALVETAEYKRQPPELRERFDGFLPAPHPLWIVPFHLVLDGIVIAVVWRSGRGEPSGRAERGERPA